MYNGISTIGVVYLLLIILLLEVDEQDIYSLHMMISVKLYCQKK